MARLESVALGGFFATPPHLIPIIASHLRFSLPPPPESRYETDYAHVSILDPCAGAGDALEALCDAVGDERVEAYAVELEETRAKACTDVVRPRSRRSHNAHGYRPNPLTGDAFRVQFRTSDDGGVSALYLNPPYDQDKVFKRLEARWLDRWTSALRTDGVLVFVIPFYVLGACAEHLATHYTCIRAYRFPGDDFRAFQQCVVFAHKVDARMAPDPALLALVQGWDADGATMDELRQRSRPLYDVPVGKNYGGAFDEWVMRDVDFHSVLAQYKPWHVHLRGGAKAVPIPGLIPDGQIRDSLLRIYPVATPPRPAHIAAGIAAGIFNGSRIVPNADRPELPHLLVKGCFDREYKTIDQKQNKHGDVTGEIQVQQPKLVVTALDLSTSTYHRLGTGTEASGGTSVADMNVADLLNAYSDSLTAVMATQCPTLYDPKRDAGDVLAPAPRPLYTAQAHAARALVRLLRREPDHAACFLGELGSGKSATSLVAARTYGSRRTLIMCPPHLLDSWRNEIAAVAPDCKVVTLESVEDLDRLPTEPFVAILSRETAKLGHAHVPVTGPCPKCGTPVPVDVDLAKKRATCEAKTLVMGDDVARVARDLAEALVPFARRATITNILGRGRFAATRLDKQKIREPFVSPPDALLARALVALVQCAIGDAGENGYGSLDEKVGRAIVLTLHALGRDDWTAWTASWLMGYQDTPYAVRSLGDRVRLLLPSDHPLQVPAHERDDLTLSHSDQYHASNLADLDEGRPVNCYVGLSRDPATLELHVKPTDGEAYASRSLRAYTKVLSALATVGTWSEGAECGEPLYQAVPEPRRVALARHIVRYHRQAFDFVIVDEVHELTADNSAQARAGHRLTGMRLPTIVMTGSVMNGYAESLYNTMWAVSSDFRSEFDHDDRQRFIDRFGYRKRMVEDRIDGKVVEFGSHSDRVVRSERVIGNAPGVLPVFVLRHLLPVSVTLHKTDLALDLPECKQFRYVVEPTADQRRSYQKLRDALVAQIKSDMFAEDLSGKLFGQLAELPSYLDRATRDVGNCESGDYVICYPESVGGDVVATAPGLEPDVILPKEEWLLRTVQEELEAGRNVMVFSWHLGLLPRLARLLEERTGEKAPILYADKVPTAKRQGWIDREIVQKRRRLLVTNPVCIQTGLNNLVHFASECWMENPGCSPYILRQAIGRVDRIGQKAADTRIHFPIYGDTLQEDLYDLLMRKVGVSLATDGLDATHAMEAAGLGESDMLAGMSIGRQLWRRMMGDAA